MSVCPHGEKVLSYVQSEPHFFQVMPVVSHPPAMHYCEEPGSINCLLIGAGGLLLSPPKAIPSPC